MSPLWMREHQVEWGGHPCWCRNIVERERYLTAVAHAYLAGKIDYQTLTSIRRGVAPLPPPGGAGEEE